MERMAGIDAGFLYMEARTLPMHTLKIAVLEPSPGWDASLETLTEAMRERMHLLPPLRRRVLRVPLGLHHPVWIDDPEFDLRNHLQRIVAPPPGGPSELDAIVSEIAAVPLPRERPLWTLSLVVGLAGGRIAAVAKIHHAVADGVAIAELLANVMSVGAPPSVPPAPPWQGEPLPAGTALAAAALRDRLAGLAGIPALLAKTARNLRRLARHRAAATTASPRPLLDVPRAPFDGALTERRAFATASLSLGDVKAVKSAFGVTVNDVLLAVVAGSLRRYLEARRALPDRPLVVEVPVSTDGPGEPRRLSGNRVANIFTSLHTDVADPVERLQRIHDTMIAGKEANRLLGPELFAEWTEHTPPAIFAWIVRQYARWRIADLHRPPINAIVSCVPGPRERLHWAEGRLHALYSVGPIVEGVGLNVTAWSYVDRLDAGILTCPDLLPDPREVGDGMRAALAELRAAADGRESAAGARRAAGG